MLIGRILIALGCAVFATEKAAAAPVGIAGGETVVGVNMLPLTVTPVGGATVNPDGKVVFPITGGLIDATAGTALIEHDGSGVSLDDGSTSVSVVDFVIDVDLATLSGDLTATVAGTTDMLTLFDLAPSGNATHPVSLLISDELDGVLGALFGDGANPLGFAGAEFGVASTSPTPVPLPAAAPMLVAGLAAVAAAGRRRRARGRAAPPRV